jgi:hypothetical protein
LCGRLTLDFCNNIGTFRDKVTYTAHRYSDPTGVTTVTTIIPRDEVAALEAERDLLRAQLAKARQARAPVHPPVTATTGPADIRLIVEAALKNRQTSFVIDGTPQASRGLRRHLGV